MIRRPSLLAGLLLVTASAWLAAQGPAAGPVPASQRFDVVSIKPIKPYPAYPNFFVEGDKLRGNHVTAAIAVARAYGVDRRQLIGGPAWINSEHYNIDARAGRTLPLKTDSGHLQEPVASMLRTLLADRFALRVRRDTREMPAYALVRIRPDLTPSEQHLRSARINCGDFETRLYEAKTKDAELAAFGDCFERTGGELHVRGRTMERLATQLAGHFNRAVIDETGLPGLLDIDLTWRGRQLPRLSDGVDELRAQEREAIRDALKEQLGMELEERMAPLPVIIIERIARPTPN